MSLGLVQGFVTYMLCSIKITAMFVVLERDILTMIWWLVQGISRSSDIPQSVIWEVKFGFA